MEYIHSMRELYKKCVGLRGVQITLIVIISKYLEVLMLTNKTSEQILNMLNKML